MSRNYFSRQILLYVCRVTYLNALIYNIWGLIILITI